MIYGTVLCLGDSLTAGARADCGPHAGLGYPEWLAPLLDRLMAQPLDGEPTEWAVLNRGISGQTTRQILDRTPAAVRELASLPGAKWCVVLAGTNDSKVGTTPIDEWELMLRQVLHWPRRMGIPIAIATFPTVDPAAMPMFTAASVDWLKQASERVRAVAAELDGSPVPVRVVELSAMAPSLLVDGVHLTQRGYREIAVSVAQAITGADPAAVWAALDALGTPRLPPGAIEATAQAAGRPRGRHVVHAPEGA